MKKFISHSTLKILSLFLVWRIYLFVIAYLSGKLFAFSPSFPYSETLLKPSGLPQWIWSFANFDGVHYLTIAQHGYSAQFTQVFFPIYPLLINIVQSLFPSLNIILIGLLISNISLLFSMIIFVKLLKFEGYHKFITWVLLFLLFFPTSFFFASFYSESFFLLGVLLTFYFMRKKNWLLAGIMGAVASATRFIGFFLFISLIWEWYSLYTQKKITQIKTLLPIFLVPLGLISYMTYLQFKFGDLLMFWHVQGVFGAQRSGTNIILLPQVIWRYMKILTTVSIMEEIYWISFLELLLTVAALILLIIAYKKRIRLTYLIFSAFAVIIPTLTGTLSSMPRYILVAFPLFMSLAMIKSLKLKLIIIIISILAQLVLVTLFTNGYWVS